MKYSPSYNEFHSIQGRPLYHPTFQSPSINSYNSYNSLKPTITRSLNSSKLKFSSMKLKLFNQNFQKNIQKVYQAELYISSTKAFIIGSKIFFNISNLTFFSTPPKIGLKR